jgi:E3 ubiquitin-protein ligase UBR3
MFQMSGNQPPSEIMINESIISLLLKLHSKLSCVPDSYFPFWETPQAEKLISDARNGVDNGLKTDTEDPTDFIFSYSQLYDLLNPEDSRIGDGAFFIKKLLDKIGAKDEICRQNIIHVREKLWPRKAEDEEELRAREEKEKESRRRKAKERQSKLMAEFAKKQQQFMEKAMTKEYNEDAGMADGSSSDSFSTPAADESSEAIKPIEYDCVICNQTSASTVDNPVGLVILLQPSSVLGHRTKQGSEVCTMNISA